MHPFEETISIVGPIVLGIIVLAVFFKFTNWLGGRSGAAPQRLAIQGVFDDNTRATVHLSNRTNLEDVRIVGFTDSQSGKGACPWELHGMVVLEDPHGGRTLVRAKLIRMIEIPPQRN